jgi:hypothetical protein
MPCLENRVSQAPLPRRRRLGIQGVERFQPQDMLGIELIRIADQRKVDVRVTGFEYWSLGKDYKRGGERAFGYVETPLRVPGKRSGILPEEFLPLTLDHLERAVGGWLAGDEPFTARVAPDFPGYSDYDQLMRLQEWMGREQ